MKRIGRLLFGFFFVIANSAFAEIFCVDTAEEIQAALTTAASNGQDDEVQIVQGIYLGNFVYATASESYDLKVAGGYTADCASQTLDPNNTILDGGTTSRTLFLSAVKESVNIRLAYLAIVNGLSKSGEPGAGLFASIEGIGSITIDSNIFSNNNSASEGGGVYIAAFKGVATIERNTFTSNKAFSGGAITAYGEDVKIVSNVISGNKTTVGSGGGIYICCGEGKYTLQNNDVRNNEAAGAGGGIYMAIDNSTSNVIGNIAVGNKSNWFGGGMALGVRSSDINIFNNTIGDNISGTDGGGLQLRAAYYFVDPPSAILKNNIFLGNRAASKSHEISFIYDDYTGYAMPKIPINLYNNNFDEQKITSSSDNIEIIIHVSNLNIDPLFFDAASGDLHLQPGSPMINAGYPSTPDLPLTDIAGGLRIVGGVVDIGAYEYHKYESCDKYQFTLENEDIGPGGDNYSSEVGIDTLGSVIISSVADVILTAPIIQLNPGFTIEAGAQLLLRAQSVSCPL